VGNPLQLINDIFQPVFQQPVFNLLIVIYEVIAHVLPVGAFAAAIVVLTLLLRCAMIPLTRKQLKSSREMQVLAPRLKELQAQYRNNPQELMAAQRALYKEHGVSPASGCLPLLVQMPFLYALYGAFLTVLPRTPKPAPLILADINAHLYPFVPQLHALPNTHFLWTNLALPDPLHILPIVAAILTFIQLRMAMPVRPKPAPGTATQPDPTTQATSMMQYIMPFFTLFIGWTFASGLALYWTVSTAFSAGQQYFLSGLGSLFVGVPGMEHLVPEPKLPPTPTTSRAPATARALTAATPAQPPAEGGLRGMLKQIRDSMAAAQSQATEQAEQRQQQAAAPKTPASAAPAKLETTGTSTLRRTRPSKEGPMLIKPAASKRDDELPEQAITRDATDKRPENGELPEQAIARLAASDGVSDLNGTGAGNGNGSSKNAQNGATPTAGKNGKSAQNGVNGVSGAKRVATNANGANGTRARPGAAPRKSGGSKNMNAPRPRGSRPKGGR
jgi:YidC/Oxa1 family membrane protein insertase